MLGATTRENRMHEGVIWWGNQTVANWNRCCFFVRYSSYVIRCQIKLVFKHQAVSAVRVMVTIIPTHGGTTKAGTRLTTSSILMVMMLAFILRCLPTTRNTVFTEGQLFCQCFTTIRVFTEAARATPPARIITRSKLLMAFSGILPQIRIWSMDCTLNQKNPLENIMECRRHPRHHLVDLRWRHSTNPANAKRPSQKISPRNITLRSSMIQIRHLRALRTGDTWIPPL